MKERPELFMQADTVRPGVSVSKHSSMLLIYLERAAASSSSMELDEGLLDYAPNDMLG